MSMLSFKSSVEVSKSSVGISAARLRSGTTCAVLELDGVAGAIPAGRNVPAAIPAGRNVPASAVLELASPVSSASVGSEGARFLVGCASRIGSPVSGSTCSDKVLREGDVITA